MNRLLEFVFPLFKNLSIIIPQKKSRLQRFFFNFLKGLCFMRKKRVLDMKIGGLALFLTGMKNTSLTSEDGFI
jgi:hypothetical protein